MLVLDEMFGLELSNFSKQLKMKTRINDDHQVIVEMSNDLWFRETEIDEEEKPKRQNAKETKTHLVLATKLEVSKWLHLNSQIAPLAPDYFERGPAMIATIRAYLLR